MKNDKLSLEKIKQYLGKTNDILSISLYDTLDSTNTRLKAEALAGAEEGRVIIASSQTGGKGRLGRSFYSPTNSGIYMSILLKPNLLTEATLITTAAAVAVSIAVENISGKSTDIKWVNDVRIDGKKICGILTESVIDTENGKMKYAVLGIGLNVYMPEGGFPAEIKDIAGAIFDEEVNEAVNDRKNRLTAEVLKNVMRICRNLDDKSYLNEYRKRCGVLGKRINVVGMGKQTPALAVDIDENCRLLVRYDDGKEELISSGEISIRQ